MKGVKIFAVFCCSVAFLVTAVMAQAATIRVRCEKRSDKNRSKVSVDSKDLTPGDYQAQVMSGSNTATSDLQASAGDQVEVDFNSDPDNITAGATPISANFIQGGQVTGKILDVSGATVISDTVSCKVKD